MAKKGVNIFKYVKPAKKDVLVYMQKLKRQN